MCHPELDEGEAISGYSLYLFLPVTTERKRMPLLSGLKTAVKLWENAINTTFQNQWIGFGIRINL